MKNILTDYTINQQTTALLPAKQIDYDTCVIEQDKQFFVKKPAFQLIKDACLTYGSSYEGRRDAVMHQTGFKRKVSIPISIHKNIYTFPTHSPNDYECIWLFYNHIQTSMALPPTKESSLKSIIVFKNGQQLPLQISHHIIEKQMERTEICKFRFSEYMRD